MAVATMARARLGRTIVTPGVVQNIERQVTTRATQFLEAVGAEAVAYLRSLTSEMRPPIGAATTSPWTRRTTSPGRLARIVQRRLPERSSMGRGGARPAHPGHWADVTGQLAASYAYSVRATATGGVLRLSNSAKYAIYLEEREGFFVLSGAMEPGGPVDQIITRLAAEYGFKVQRLLGERAPEVLA